MYKTVQQIIDMIEGSSMLKQFAMVAVRAEEKAELITRVELDALRESLKYAQAPDALVKFAIHANVVVIG